MESRSTTELMPRTFSDLASQGERGFSLAEITIVIAAIAVLAAIAIPAITGAVSGTQASLAEGNLATLNQALLRHNHANTNFVSVPDSSSDDEMEIFQMLRTRDPKLMGSPFISSSMTVTVSGDEKTYRAVWNGRMFQLAPVGIGGSGLNLLEMRETGNGN